MSRSAREVQIEPDEAAYRAAADAWRPGDPVPLLPGPAAAGPDGPAVPGPRPGQVLSFGGATTRAAAGLLARATGRPHRHVAPGAVAGVVAGTVAGTVAEGTGPVAVVALAADVDRLGDWPLPAGAEAGLVTGRGPAALAAVVRRTLAAPGWPPAPVRVLAHPAFPSAATADATERRELDRLTGPGSGLLVLQSHGRECCVHLPDAVLCGRADAGAPLPPGPVGGAAPDGADRWASCQQGAGCIRRDLPDPARVAASALTGRLVAVHSCNSVGLGVTALSGELSLALGLLDGSAVAVVGTLGLHTAELAAMDRLAGLVGSGRRLGEVVAELNRSAAGRAGTLGTFVLLGDPALVPADWTTTPATTPAGTTPAGTTPAGTTPAGTTPAGAGRAGAGADRTDPWDHAAPDPGVAELSRLADTVLPELDRLRWLAVPVDRAALAAAEDAVAAAWTRHLASGPGSGTAFAAAVAAARAAVRDLHLRVVSDLLADAYADWWQFGGPPAALREVDAGPLRCPHCGRGSGRRVRYAHRLRPGLAVELVDCLRCGPLSWTTGPGPAPLEHALAAEVEGPVGTVLQRPARLRNRTGRELLGGAGAAVVNGAAAGWPAPVASPLAVPPAGTTVLPHAYDARGPGLLPDRHDVVSAWCVEGRLVVATGVAWLRTAPDAAVVAPGAGRCRSDQFAG